MLVGYGNNSSAEVSPVAIGDNTSKTAPLPKERHRLLPCRSGRVLHRLALNLYHFFTCPYHLCCNLKNQTPLGAGVDRTVYRHPENPELCIKIPRYATGKDLKVTEIRDKIFCLSRFGDKRGLDFNYTDVRYADMLQKRNRTELFNHLPRCYGQVETDLGTGVIWEYIANYDNTPCLSLLNYKNEPERIGNNEKEMLWDALDIFFSWQVKHAVMLREMAFSNTLIRKINSDSIRLYHIDAIGCVDLLPLADYSKSFARLRVRSKVYRFRKRIIPWLGAPPQKTNSI